MNPLNRTAVIGTATLTLVLAACQKSTPPEETLAEATPAPANAPTAALAAPELAPPGVFFLIAQVSFETRNGISRLTPGKRLQRVRPGKYTADGHEVALRDDQVTNDLAFARAVAEDDARAQSAIRQSIATRPAATAASAPAQAQVRAQTQAQAVAQPPTARTPLGSSLDGGAHDQHRDPKRWHKTITGGWIYN